MLSNLTIKNYALIENLHVSFSTGLSMITGETGAGKSIILGALHLLLGKRADLKSIKEPSVKCVIEGVFEIENYSIESFFNSIDIEYDSETIVRREILPSGKSRAFINDTPVALTTLQTLGNKLVDIHSQNDTSLLGKQSYQLELLDALANTKNLLSSYSKSLYEYKKAAKELEQLKEEKEALDKELDYTSFLVNEFKELQLDQFSITSLEEEQATLANVEFIQETIGGILEESQEETMGSLTILNASRRKLQDLAQVSDKYKPYWERLQSSLLEIEDVIQELEREKDVLHIDPERLIQVNETLSLYSKLINKHNVTNQEELKEVEKSLNTKLEKAIHSDSNIELLETKVKELEIETRRIAKKIHEKREAIAPKVATQILKTIHPLGMENAQLEFDLNMGNQFASNGLSTVSLMFSANAGIAKGPIQKIASGGEQSRIMLALKSVLSRHKALPTLIFDEIDTGVSGEISLQMASIMEQMSTTMQVLCITHLPQIAARGKHQYKVVKENKETTTQTYITKLTAEERIVEIAQMIAGKEVSTSALAHAKELLN